MTTTTTKNTSKRMTSKFAGACTICKHQIPAGSDVVWTPSGLTKGIHHGDTAICVKNIEAAGPVYTPPPAPSATMDASPIVAFLTAARERGLKFPSVRFLAPDGGELRLHLAGAQSKYPGAVQVHLGSEWIGRVEATGRIAGRTLNQRPELVDALNTIAANPSDAASAYGKLTGNCSFCDRHLEDAGSVEVGYGPICAKRYGLPHKPKGTPVMHALVA